MKPYLCLLFMLGLQTACQGPGSMQGQALPTPQASSPLPGAEPTPIPIPPATPTPCAGERCAVANTGVAMEVTPAQVCAGDTLSLRISNLDKAYPEQDRINLIIVSNPNYGQDMGPTGKGRPPYFTFSDKDLTLASAAIAPDGTASLSAKLAAQYGPDPGGSMIQLEPGASNGSLYLRIGTSYHGVSTRLCP